MTPSVRILIVDDQELFREGLHTLLSVQPDLQVVGEARNGEEALRLAEDLKPDVVLMDLLLPKLGGIEATEKIRHELPDTQVIALTSVLEDASVVGAVKAGARVYARVRLDTCSRTLPRKNWWRRFGRLPEAQRSYSHLLPGRCSPSSRACRPLSLPRPNLWLNLCLNANSIFFAS